MFSRATKIYSSSGVRLFAPGDKSIQCIRAAGVAFQDGVISREYSSSMGNSSRGLIIPSKREQSTTTASAPSFSASYNQAVDVFPSLVVGADRKIVPQGVFAEAQAQFLDPDPREVSILSEKLEKANMGIVAHYYMDVELQGVLQAVGQKLSGNRVAVADSLAMGDHAVKMCDAGATAIACLGVDFMSESVSAILQRNGYGHIPVYRAQANKIGCSLAEAAERDSYRAWLTNSQDGDTLHVVYINTSLETKAVSSSLVPTITCTSSNVLNTLLQASAQVGPSLKILYGPDTYMGNNLVTMFDSILESGWDDAKIQSQLHPQHNRESIQQLRDNINVFPNGNCVVHHMFGTEVVNAVKRNYDDAFVTAHLEVPGEMFQIAMQKSLEGRGIVGSTSDILKFISKKVDEAAKGEEIVNGDKNRLRFILGTEAGMVTSIVKSVQDILETTGNKNVEAEIVFPVASSAVSSVDEDDAAFSDLSIVPGVSGGEGCSTAGGCATCPFMKMNDLDALNDVLDMVVNKEAADNEARLKGHLPPDRLRGKVIGGVDAIDLGSESILHMRQFMQEKTIPESLLKKVMQSN